MRLIRLTSAVHGGSLYIDADRVLGIEPGEIQAPPGESEKDRAAITLQFWTASEKLGTKANDLKTDFADPVAVGWLNDMRKLMGELHSIYTVMQAMANNPYGRQNIACTLISLACGTALEQGVMLTRFAVKEQPSEVADRVNPCSAGMTTTLQFDPRQLP